MSEEIEQHLDRAEERLCAAQGLLDLGYPGDAISRSYYAMFHAATAVLMELGIQRSSHHALWAAFGEHVAARGLMDPRLHRMGLDAFRDRARSDYFADPGDTMEDGEETLRAARDFVAACRQFLESR